MALFTKPKNEISFEDINAFCREEIDEGIRIEYKKEFPSDNQKTAKEISSFANTYGGLLLIGVAEKDRKPVLPINGIAYERGLDEKINSICFKLINPPVFPEIRICQFPEDDSRAIVLIRVQESNDTPHRIDHDKKTYIRIASANEPVEAPFEQIEWLMNRRKKAEENRERLLIQSRERFLSQYAPGVLLPIRGMSIIPLYPHKELISHFDLHSILLETRIKMPFNNSEDFPFRVETPITIANGIVFKKEYPRYKDFIFYTEINSFGLISYQERIEEDFNSEGAPIKSAIEITDTVEKIYLPLLLAKRFYGRIGYWGLIKINLFFENIRGRYLSANERYKNSFDTNLNFESNFSVSYLNDNFDEIIRDLLKEFLWSFNCKEIAGDSGQLNVFIQREKKSLEIRGFSE